MNNQNTPQDNVPQGESNINTILPHSSEKELKTYIPIRQPEERRDKNISPLFDAIMCSIADRLKEFTDHETFNKVWVSSLFPERLSKQLLRLTEQHSDPLHHRIAELEKNKFADDCLIEWQKLTIAELEKDRLDAGIEIAELQVTVALLEAQNSRYREALEEISEVTIIRGDYREAFGIINNIVEHVTSNTER